MVVAVSPRVRMVLRVGRCTELIGSRFLRMMASVFTLPHGGVLGLRGRQLYCEQGKGCGEAEVVEEACCIAYPHAMPPHHPGSMRTARRWIRQARRGKVSHTLARTSRAGAQPAHSTGTAKPLPRIREGTRCPAGASRNKLQNFTRERRSAADRNLRGYRLDRRQHRGNR